MIALILLASALLAQTALAQTPTHSATLTWTDTLNPAGTTYNALRATGLCSGSPTFATIATAIVPKTYVDATVTQGNYCYGVTATTAGVQSAMSNTVAAAIPNFAPTNLSVQVACRETVPRLTDPAPLLIDVEVGA